MEYTLVPQQEFLSPRTHICWEAPVVHNLALSLLFPSVSYTFLLCDLASLLSIFSFFPLVLKQAVYCVCSAEQPALKAVYMCVSVFVPARLSDHVNPLRGPAHLLPALPPFFPSTGLHWLALPSQPPDMLSHLSITTHSDPQGPITWEVTPH